jgi:adenosylhomocysteine nucleosidase
MPSSLNFSMRESPEYNRAMPQAVRVLILTALETEARAIARAFHWPRTFSDGIVCHGDQALAVVGLKAARLDSVAAQFEFQALIIAGLAGALAPQLRVGDLVADGDFPASLSNATPSMHRGRIHTSPNLVASPAEKRALFDQTGALAVDMESGFARALAENRGTPFLALRAVSDAASDPLDPALLSLIDSRGRPRIGRAAALVARRPGTLPELLRIGRATRRALSHLSAVLVALLASGWPDASLASESARR